MLINLVVDVTYTLLRPEDPLLSIEALPAPAAGDLAPAKRRSGTMRMLARNPSVVIGAAIVAFLALVGLFAPLLGTIDPSEINPVYRNKMPGVERMIRDDDGKETVFVHRMGTDTLGRDIYSRVVYGARVSLIVGVMVAALSVAVGLIIGLIAGYIRWLDGIIMRIMDGLMAIPAILLAIASSRCRAPGSWPWSSPSSSRRFRASCGWCARSCCRSARSPMSRPPSRSARRRRRCSCATCCPTPSRR